MKKFVVILALTLEIPCLAQEAPRHAISGEIFGLGAIGISAQYDYMFKHSTKGFYDVRAGIGGWYYPNDNYAGITVPHAITYNFGQLNRFLEAGLGGTFANEYHGDNPPSFARKYFMGPMIGYRSISPKGFQFRLYINGFYGGTVGLKSAFFPFAGIGFGKVLGRMK